MRLTFVNPYFYPMESGIERIIAQVSRGLALRDDFDVSVVTSNLRFPHGTFSDQPTFELTDGVAVHRLPVRYRNFGSKFYYHSNGGTVIKRLLQVILKTKPQVIHVYNCGAPVWLAYSNIAARLCRAKLIYSPHYHPPYDGRSLKGAIKAFPMDVLHNLSTFGCHRIVHCTSYDIEAFKQYSSASRPVTPVVIAPGVKSQPNIGEKRHGMVLFVGRVDDFRKGFDILECAFERISRCDPTITLDVVGQCSESTKARLHKHFGAKVTVHGVVDDLRLYELYRRSELFVMPSRYEGYGMPYFEAMVSGTPVVATTCGPLPEIIPSSCGYLVPVEDVNALEEVILMHFKEPDKAREMSSNCVNHARGMDWKVVVERHAAMYNELYCAND